MMPGQNTEDSALVSMVLVPWWAACRVVRTLCLSDGGINTLSLYRITPSTVDKWSRMGKYIRRSSGRSEMELGKPSSIVSSNVLSVSSLAVAVRTKSHVTDVIGDAWNVESAEIRVFSSMSE